MRVIGGIRRGMNLFAPEGDDIRPTYDRVKEDIFNILSVKVPGSSFLDLYAGTGAIGLEAISRSAEHVTLVENSKKAISLIEKNMAKARFENFTIVKDNVKHYLYNTADRFDIIFMDPPYSDSGALSAMNEVFEKGLLNEGGVLAVERAANDPMPEIIRDFEMYRRKDYAATSIFFYRSAK